MSRLSRDDGLPSPAAPPARRVSFAVSMLSTRLQLGGVPVDYRWLGLTRRNRIGYPHRVWGSWRCRRSRAEDVGGLPSHDFRFAEIAAGADDERTWEVKLRPDDPIKNCSGRDAE